MNKTKVIGVGLAILFSCILITFTIANTLFYMTPGVCFIISLIITALTLLILCLHWRISHLEHQVEALRKEFYSTTHIR